MKMLDTELVLVLQLLNLFQRSVFVVLLILRCRLYTLLYLFANKQDLAVFII